MNSKGPYNGLETFFGKPLSDKAEELGYSLENILILKGKLEKLKTDYPETYKKLFTCNHNRDRRTP